MYFRSYKKQAGDAIRSNPDLADAEKARGLREEFDYGRCAKDPCFLKSLAEKFGVPNELRKTKRQLIGVLGSMPDIMERAAVIKEKGLRGGMKTKDGRTVIGHVSEEFKIFVSRYNSINKRGAYVDPRNLQMVAETVSTSKAHNYHKYAILDPRPTPEAKEHNEKIFASGPVLGIEVTIPELANRCDLGNIDPQHTDKNSNETAIEAALKIDLINVPPDATFVTIRPDLDSVGAMLVLTLRSRGVEVDASYFPKVLEAARVISESDKFARGKWPGRQPLPTPKDPWAGNVKESRLAAVGACVSDFKLPIEERVKAMEEWMLRDKEPVGYREIVYNERKKLAEAIERGEIKIQTFESPTIVLVESVHRAATSIGYRLAPIVIAVNPEFKFQGGSSHRKITIAQYEPGYVDLKSIWSELSKYEEGWGGSPCIGGSPQDVSSKLDGNLIEGIIHDFPEEKMFELEAKEARIAEESFFLALSANGKQQAEWLVKNFPDLASQEKADEIQKIIDRDYLKNEWSGEYIGREASALIAEKCNIPWGLMAAKDQVTSLILELPRAMRKTARIKKGRIMAKTKHAELKRETGGKGLNPPHENQVQGKTWKQIVCMKNQLAGV